MNVIFTPYHRLLSHYYDGCNYRKFMCFLVLLCVFVSGCGGGKKSDLEGTHLREHSEPIEGDITPLVKSFSQGKNLSACDVSRFSEMLKIASELDARQQAIKDFSTSPSAGEKDPRYTYVQVGPIVVREEAQEFKARPGLRSDHYSWDEIITDYKTIAQSTDPRLWSILNSQVRGILTDDKDRILKGYAYAVGYNDEKFLQGISKKVTKCLQNTSSCDRLDFNKEEGKWLEKQADYSSLLSDFSKKDLKLEALQTLEKYIQMDIKSNFGFRKNPQIRREGSNLWVPIYAGPFESVVSVFDRYIEAFWKSNNLNVRMHWMPKSPELFSMVLMPGTGGRSFVSRSEKKVALYNEVKARSIAHEIGHVIGFPDKYYVLWDNESCRYESQFREDDLMSSTTTGVVSKEDWARLDIQYPLLK